MRQVSCKNVLGDLTTMADSISIRSCASREEAELLKSLLEANGIHAMVSADDFDAPDQGWFSAPAVVIDAPRDCALMREESFGPVIGITAVDGDAEAVQRMNDSDYGLTASIWTSDPDRAVRSRFALGLGPFDHPRPRLNSPRRSRRRLG